MVSRQSKREMLETVHPRYLQAGKKRKTVAFQSLWERRGTKNKRDQDWHAPKTVPVVMFHSHAEVGKSERWKLHLRPTYFHYPILSG